MGFARQEYQSGLPFLLQEIFPTQGLNPHTAEPPGKASAADRQMQGRWQPHLSDNQQGNTFVCYMFLLSDL